MPNTYARSGMGTSNIDVTLTTPMLEARIKNWRVLENVTDSDHKLIAFTLSGHEPINCQEQKRFLTRKADWPAFVRKLTLLNESTMDNGDIHVRADTLTGIILEAAKGTIPRQDSKGVRLKPPWWTKELDISKKKLNKSRRELLRADNDENKKAHSCARNVHVHTIRLANMKSWRCFAEDLNSNPWSKAFKWLKKGKVENTPTCALKDKNGMMSSSIDERAKIILNNFAPHDVERISDLDLDGGEEPVVPSIDEIKKEIWRMKPNKSPGLDCITAGMLRKAWPVIHNRISNVFSTAIIP